MKYFYIILHLVVFIFLLSSISSNAQWVQSNGLYGGDINAITVSGSTIFAGTDSYFTRSKIYYSSNNGETWTESSSGIPDGFNITALEGTGSIIYAGLGSYDSGGSVYYSTNKGFSWQRLSQFSGKGDIISIKVIGTKITISSFDGVFSSIDNGSKWQKLDLVHDEIYGSSYHLGVAGNILYAFNSKNAYDLSGIRPVRITLNLPENCYRHSFVPTELGLLDGTDMGIFRYSKLAKKWFKVDKNLTNTDVRTLVIKDSYVYAGTSTGIFYSSLDCENWKKVGISNPVISTLAISGTSVFAGSGDFGICRSTDNGASWSEVNSGISAEVIQNIADLTVSNSKLYAISGGLEGGEQSSYFSINNGATWTEVPEANKIIKADTLVRLGKNLFTLENGKVVLSINNGQSWKEVGIGLLKDYEIHSLAVSGNNLIAGTEVGVFISKNNGTSWTEFCSGLPKSPWVVTSLAVSGNNLYAATSGGLFMSKNFGDEWVKIRVSAQVSQNIIPISITVYGTNLFVWDWYNILCSKDEGVTWSDVSGGSSKDLRIESSGSNLFRVGEYCHLSQLSENKQDWLEIENDLPDEAKFSSFSVWENNIFAFIKDGVAAISTNKGKNWMEVINDLPKGVEVSHLTNLNANLYAVTTNGLFRSSNKGKNWLFVGNGLPKDINIITVAVSGSKLFVGTDVGLYSSVDDGANWKMYRNGIPSLTSIFSIASAGSNLCVGTNKGIFRSINNGESWTEVNQGLSNCVGVNAISVTDADIILGTKQGVWKRPLEELKTTEN